MKRRAVSGLLLSLFAPLGARAQPERARESLVKAAFVNKFPSFVEWPPESLPTPTTPLRVGVLGDDQLARDLRELASAAREGRPMQVVRLAPGESLQGFHVLYIRGTSSGRMADLLLNVPERTLTVCDADGAHPAGSVISFFTEEGRVRFNVSLEAATRQRLRLSSRMLSVARVVPG